MTFLPSNLWEEMPKEPWRSKKDPEANIWIISLEQKISRLSRENKEQAEEIKSIAWMCKECQSTFPSMLVKSSLIGETVCPRCDSKNKIVRAHEAIPVIMKEKIQRLQLFEEENKELKAEVKRLNGYITTLREELNKARTRPGGGRKVEGEDNA